MRSRVRLNPANLLILLGAIFLVGSALAWAYHAWDMARAAAEVRRHIEEEATNPAAFLRATATATPTPTPSPRPTSTPTPIRRVTQEPARTVTPLPSPTPSLTPSPTASPTPTATPLPPAPPVRLLIPALGIDTPVVPVSIRLVDSEGGLVATWETADYAAGFHQGSAYPGQPGNVVISGHNNIKGRVFRPISALGEPDVPFPQGALVYLFDAHGRIFAYAFDSMYKVQEAGAPLAERIRNARFMAQTSEPVLTLITCWPLNNNTHRIIVRARYVGEIDPSRLQDVAPVQ